jgi:hypothetical protein
MKALSRADFKLEKGDVRAFGPYFKIIAEFDRRHGAAPANPCPRPARGQEGFARPAGRPDLRCAAPAGRPGLRAGRYLLFRPTR